MEHLSHHRLIIPATDGGADGWPLRITLIDFGQSIDLREYATDVLFSGMGCAASGFECVEMREVRPGRASRRQASSQCAQMHSQDRPWK